MREKPASIIVRDNFVRITPACAGKTEQLNLSEILTRDHPRVCGKNVVLVLRSKCCPGSPPRVREKLVYILITPPPCRITPACAGKTICTCARHHRKRDHPRVCGKNRTTELVGNLDEGSPPRVREKRHVARKIVHVVGITPACAGKTLHLFLP